MLLGVALLAAATAFVWFRSIDRRAPEWTSRPFVSTSAEESESRISPDAQWLSFVWRSGGRSEVHVQRLDGGEAQRVQIPDGVVLSHVWSPDGSRIACLLRQDRTARLVVVPAFFGGTPSVNLGIAGASGPVKLLRWIDDRVYFTTSDRTGNALASLTVATGTVQPISASWPVEGKPRDFDVSPDGRRVVFTMTTSGQDDLWTADLDGASASRLTDDAFFERNAIWSGRSDAVFYQSNRGGQIDVWETQVDSRTSRALTSGPTAEVPSSASADGRFISLELTSESAHLWLFDGDRPRQLTDDALRDASPSAAETAVAFERSRPIALGGDPLSDSRVFTATFDQRGALGNVRALADGFAPLMSPDGQRVAYLQVSPDPTRATLVVKDLATAQVLILSKDARPPGYSLVPNEWIERHMAWSHAGTELYFIDRADRWTVRRFRVGAPGVGEPVFTTAAGELLHGLALSPDGTRLAVLSGSRTQSRLHFVNVASGAAVDVAVGSAVNPLMRGWLASGAGVVIVQPGLAYDDFTSDLDVLLVSPSGGTRNAGRLARAFASTSRLDPVREVLYAATLEAGVANIVALPLARGGAVRVTDNTLPGIGFGGLEPRKGGGILGVRFEGTSDIWLMERVSQ